MSLPVSSFVSNPLNRPLSQAVQALCPTTEAYLPGWQFKQAATPYFALYLPFGHDVHLTMSPVLLGTDAYLPGGQRKAKLSDALDAVPGTKSQKFVGVTAEVVTPDRAVTGARPAHWTSRASPSAVPNATATERVLST